MPRKPNAFTLVEILIVVVILGILASIVIPQFASASQDAIKSVLRDQIQTVDNMIEYYRVQNAGTLPTSDPVDPFGASGGWGVLVSSGYLKDTPFNQYAGGSVTAPGTTAAAAAAELPGSATGWFFRVINPVKLDVWAAGYDEQLNRLSNEP